MEVPIATPNPEARCPPGLASYAALQKVVGAEEGAVPYCTTSLFCLQAALRDTMGPSVQHEMRSTWQAIDGNTHAWRIKFI